MPFWLDLLRTLHPPRGVMLVGAGDGSSAWLKRLVQWDAHHVTLIEGDETQFERLHDRVTDHHNWHLVQQVVAAEAVNVTYHHASLAIESGLVEPESLRPLWPHLTTRTSRTHRAVTLDMLMCDSDRTANWLVLDCLPALSLLQGAADHLQDIEVIAARVLLGSDPLASGPAGQVPLQTWLEAQGFMLLDTESGRHPAIGHALFVRDSQARLRALTGHLAEADRGQHEVTRQLAGALTASTRQAEEIRAQTDENARLAQALEAADTLARDQRHQLDQMQQACAQAATDAATLTRTHADETARLVKVQEATDALARDQQHQIEQMQQACAQAATDAATLSQTHADERARLAQALEAAEKLAADRHRIITQLRQAAVQTHAETAAQSRAHAEEVARLAQALEAAETLARDRQYQLDQVQRACTQAAVDAATLTRTHADETARLAQALEAAEKLAADRHRIITQLRQTAVQTHAETAAQSRAHAEEISRLAHALDAAETLARDQQRQLDQVQQTCTQAATDAVTVAQTHADETARLAQALEAAEKLASDRHRIITQLRQAATQADAAATAQSRVHAEEISRLVQAGKEAEQLQTSAQQRQQELAKQLEKQNQNRAAAEKLVTDLRAQSQQEANRPRGDADIDDLIRDISAYFTERSITYVDVGAYIGDVFLKVTGSRLLRVREAHLYEPNPTSYQTLTAKLESCKLPTLHAYHLAVGSRPETLHFNAAQSMTRVVEPEPGAPQISNTFTANSVSLDEQARLFTDQKINLLKIDVEGRELDVLTGASELLRAQRIDMIYIEVGFNGQGTQQTYFADIDRFLQDKGYRVFRIYEQMNEWTEDSPLLRRCNFAYMSERFARANPSKLTRRLQTLQEEIHRLKSAQTQPLTPALP